MIAFLNVCHIQQNIGILYPVQSMKSAVKSYTIESIQFFLMLYQAIWSVELSELHFIMNS